MDIDTIVKEALAEDLGSGDITTEAVLRCKGGGVGEVSAVILSRARGILCGTDVARRVFCALSSEVDYDSLADGSEIEVDQRIAWIRGTPGSVLGGERVALNFLSRLSGIATLTRRFAEEIMGTGAKILDTRKTTPLLRQLEKYAVRVGGAESHRYGLYDEILVKDNHLKILDGIGNLNLGMSFEVEVKSLNEFKTAIKLPNIRRVMLDNMDIEEIKECVKIGKGLVDIEVSGSVKLANVREIAETGVDYISVGAITHSAPALDLSMVLE